MVNTLDAYKRVSSAIFTLGTRTYTTDYQYNQGNQRTQVGHMTHAYDTAGRLSAVSGGFSNATYNVAGQLTGDKLSSSGPNGAGWVDSVTTETFGYDANRLQLISHTATTVNTNNPLHVCVPSCPPPPPGGTNLSLTYSYQASAGQMGAGSTAGNAGQLMSLSGTIGGLTESASYTYDLLRRLGTSNQTSNAQSAQRRFAYDRWGNRTTVWDAVSGGNQIQSIALEQSGGAPTNRITSVTAGSTVNYVYDAAGNVTNDGVHSYTYDPENRLVSVDGGTAQYSYDHQNRRYKKTVGSMVTHYVWDGSKVLGEYNGSTGFLQVNYWYAGERLFKKSGLISHLFLSDRLSIRLALSDNGTVAGRQGHLPFGEDFAESGMQEKHHFTSYERDGDTASDHAINRQYLQGIGRFNRPDPFGSSAEHKIPQTWNRYAYAANEPINKKDPLGLDPYDPWSWSAPLLPCETDACRPFGPAILLDGVETLSRFFCGGVIPSPSDLIGGLIDDFLWGWLSGTVHAQGSCELVIYHPEKIPKGSAWKALGWQRTNCDAVATPKGIVKVPDGCGCDVECGNGQNYEITCTCLGNRTVFGNPPRTLAAGAEFANPRDEGWTWVPIVPSYTVSVIRNRMPPPGPAHILVQELYRFQ